MDSEKVGKRLVITGSVQGIGFRPHVYRLALRHNISGSVKNTGGAVEIFASGDKSSIHAFIADIKKCEIPFADIEYMQEEDIPVFDCAGFTVEQSGKDVISDSFVPPDIAICPECECETTENGNRYGHFFNNCTSCGPRFSVIEALPYDRANTSMAEFFMCPACENEYLSPADRRFHAETICCNSCGPELLWLGSDNALCAGTAAFEKSVQVLQNGGIVLLKGIGGYHLAASPYDSGAVSMLREIKKRDCKPFAVMFGDISQIEDLCCVCDKEKDLLISPARPIVPLKIKKAHGFADAALMGNARLGCFLPYTALHKMLIQKTGPLIMTSANVSGSGIIIKDNDAFAFLQDNPQIGGAMYNNREILHPVEDSVAHVVNGKAQLLRRSRGYVPAHIKLTENTGKIFAAGGDLKSAFCLVSGEYAYLSQYMGDLEEADVFETYTNQVSQLKSMLSIRPEIAVCDKHPAYFSSAYTAGLNLPVIAVQHHHAHIASVMAEHGLKSFVLGIAFDGTGYGDDDKLWGGEFLLCNGGEYERKAHLKYFTLAGGDSAAKNARQTAFCLMHSMGINVDENFFPGGSIIKSAIENNIGCVESSSMGRLFDAVAAVLGICDFNRYEGQAAVMLQQCAEAAMQNGTKAEPMAFVLEESSGEIIISCEDILSAAYNFSGDKGGFALGFHLAVAKMAGDVLDRIAGFDCIALSGGVFQNALLTELTEKEIAQKGVNVYTNSAVPPNDGGIALGQAYIAAQLIKKQAVNFAQISL